MKAELDQPGFLILGEASIFLNLLVDLFDSMGISSGWPFFVIETSANVKVRILQVVVMHLKGN